SCTVISTVCRSTKAAGSRRWILPNDEAGVASRTKRTRRLRLVIAYDGSGFRGWQSQAHGATVQDCLEQAFASVAGERIRVHGAGRTDSGVHALGQCAHADVPAGRLTAATWLKALNALLPPQVRVLKGRFVAATFHARFEARGKVYRYRLTTTPVLSPFERGRAWHVMKQLDEVKLRAAAALFVGKHDFAGFTANRGQPPTSTTRTIHRIRVRHTAALTTIDFAGDGFLYKMVRLLTGAIVRCATGSESLNQIKQRLDYPSENGTRLVAPAEGLTLVRVRY
ncbi:MAG: tRNA pseudouridine(38-40) synthase TruA, partial [Chthoniobacterales bacterium]